MSCSPSCSSKNWFTNAYEVSNTTDYTRSAWLSDWNYETKWKKIYRDQLETISFLYYGVTQLNEYKVVVYDKNMSMLGTRYIGFGAFPYTDLSLKNFHYYSVQVGYDKIMAQAIPSAVNAFPTAKFYTVSLGYGNAGPTANHGIVARYEIVDRDCFEPVTRICWLNRKGGYDYFNFTKKNTRKVNVSRQEWTKAIPYDGTISSRGITTLSTNAVETYAVNTDYITYDEYIFLESLITSPDVYTVSEAGVLIPINLTTNDYETPSQFDAQKILNIEYKASTKINIQ